MRHISVEQRPGTIFKNLAVVYHESYEMMKFHILKQFQAKGLKSFLITVIRSDSLRVLPFRFCLRYKSAFYKMIENIFMREYLIYNISE